MKITKFRQAVWFDPKDEKLWRTSHLESFGPRKLLKMIKAVRPTVQLVGFVKGD